MKRKITLAILILVCFLLQSTVFTALKVASVVPNLLLILTVSFGFMQGKKEGLFAGFFCGLLIDLFYGDVLGLYALLYMYVGYVCGFFCKVYFDEDVKVPMIMVACADLLYGIAIYFLLFFMRGKVAFFSYLKAVILPEMVYTVLISIILYRIFYSINRRLTKGEMRGKHSLWLRN